MVGFIFLSRFCSLTYISVILVEIGSYLMGVKEQCLAVAQNADGTSRQIVFSAFEGYCRRYSFIDVFKKSDADITSRLPIDYGLHA